MSEADQPIGDIQNYLDALNNKAVEVEGSDNGVSAPMGSQLFVDGTGQYYSIISTNEDSYDVASNSTGITTRNAANIVESKTVLTTAATNESDLESNQIIQSIGENDYRTVTIVPNNTSNGEMSYVLIDYDIVPNNKKDDQIYEFENENEEELEEELNEEPKPKRGKKATTKPQAHICSYCDYSTSKKFLLVRHMRAHSEDRPHKCSVCERGFKTLVALQNHVNTHTGHKPYRCKFCMSKFTTTGEMVRHVRYKHTHEKPHKCPQCSYECVEFSKLKRHMRCHTGERPYQCPNCTYASPDSFKLKRHLRIHTGEKPYECDICGAKFTQSNSLKSHRAIHTGKKPVYKCQLCPTTCGRKTDLRVHVQKLHTSEKPLQCKMCDKTFPDRYNLKLHKKVHDGEKCFKCELCVYSTTSSRHLESHMLIHSDQKPFKCDQCSQSFRQKQLLKRHQNLYHNPQYVAPSPKEKPHTCTECNRTFRHKGNLLRHQQLHDPSGNSKKKKLELKNGRAKRVHMVNGQKVEVLPSDDHGLVEEIDDPGVVSGPDGESYIIIDMSQLETGEEEGDEDKSATHGQIIDHQDILQTTSQEKGRVIFPSILSHDSILPQAPTDEDLKIKKQQERANCFGFDDDDEDDIADD